MGIGFGLVQGLSKDATAINQGNAQRRELEQKALHEALARKLLEAQVTRTLRPPQATSQAKAAQGTWTAHNRPDGSTYKLNSLSGEIVETGAPKAVTPPVPKAPTAPKPPTVMEKETNAAARTARELIASMKQIHASNKASSELPIGTSVARGIGRLPLVGESLKGITEPAAQQFMSPEQAAYQQKADQLLHLASSVLPKGGRSMALLANLRASFTAAAGAKNPEAAQEALDELDKQLAEVLGEQGVTPKAGAPTAPPPDSDGPKYKRTR